MEPGRNVIDGERPGRGIFTVSLDFELYWGMADHWPLDDRYRSILDQTRSVVIPRLLDLFARHRIHATWATVGLLLHESIDDVLANRPSILPDYDDERHSAYRYLDGMGPDEIDDPYRLAPSIVRRIRSVPGQEIGAHSYSHFYCLEPGATDEAFAADLDAWNRAASQTGIDAVSLCFGRNQYRAASIAAASAAGFSAYRGTEPHWIYRPRSGRKDHLARKVIRMVDTYVPVTPHYTVDVAGFGGPIIDVRASRQLRNHRRRLRLLEPLKVRRITSGLRRAAVTGSVYHLWWHPQDFAESTEENFDSLVKVLEAFEELRRNEGMVSLSMGEVAALADAEAGDASEVGST